MLHKTQPKN